MQSRLGRHRRRVVSDGIARLEEPTAHADRNRLAGRARRLPAGLPLDLPRGAPIPPRAGTINGVAHLRCHRGRHAVRGGPGVRPGDRSVAVGGWRVYGAAGRNARGADDRARGLTPLTRRSHTLIEWLTAE